MPLMDAPVVPNMNPAAAQTWSAVEFAMPRLLKFIDDLTEEQLFQVPAGFRNSIATLLCHIAGSELSFAHLLTGRQLSAEQKAEYFLGRNDGLLIEPKGETKESLRAKLDTGRAALKETLLQIQPEDLEKTFDGPNGNQATTRWFLTVIAIHPSLHMGQMLMVKQHLK
jgi:uncharacterized damage-inducible protein DinB